MEPVIIQKQSMSDIIQYGIIDGKEICVCISPRAHEHLLQNGKPLYMGMELYFTYFMMKKVTFLDEKPDWEVSEISDYLYVYFRSLQSKIARIQDVKGDESDLVEMPVTRQGALVPNLAHLDRKNGKWQGDFTWNRPNKDIKPNLLNT